MESRGEKEGGGRGRAELGGRENRGRGMRFGQA